MCLSNHLVQGPWAHPRREWQVTPVDHAGDCQGSGAGTRCSFERSVRAEEPRLMVGDARYGPDRLRTRRTTGHGKRLMTEVSG